MFRYPLIRNLLILSLAMAILFPAYLFIYVQPSYNDLITEKTEQEAVRYASYMVRTLGLENKRLSKSTLPENLSESLKPVSRDKHLLKLRIFSPTGEIVFSTKQAEVGKVNKNDYFHNIVAKGNVYSKVVVKNRETAEGAVHNIDIVETYVPFMFADQFAGAFEVYYDITESVEKSNSLSRLSRVISVSMSLAFLLAIVIALHRAYVSFQERDVAEDLLRVANEDLEQKVRERTRELVDANELLTEQIAERVNAQNALAGALEEIRIDREKLDEILRSVPDGVVVADGRLNILHMNPAAEKITGSTLDEMLGCSLSELSSDVDFSKKVSQRLNTTYGAKTFDVELPCDGDKVCVYHVGISQYVPDESGVNGVVLLLRDVTRERELEQMKNAFLGMAAHELNTPLTTIIGYAELLTSKETSAQFDQQQKADYLQLIHDKALALGGLIADLLDISRVESGRALTLNYQKFNLRDTLTDVFSAYRESAADHDLQLHLPDGETEICADASRLFQVFDHLMNNAVKYSPDGGRIDVTLGIDGESYSLVVTDHGIGMSEEQLTYVYDRFYRADSSDTAVKGVGLGMSIVRHIVLAHHGQIMVESQLGHGTIVTISLPKTPRSDDAATRNPFKS